MGQDAYGCLGNRNRGVDSFWVRKVSTCLVPPSAEALALAFVTSFLCTDLLRFYDNRFFGATRSRSEGRDRGGGGVA